jgi:hypothetical protein
VVSNNITTKGHLLHYHLNKVTFRCSLSSSGGVSYLCEVWSSTSRALLWIDEGSFIGNHREKSGIRKVLAWVWFARPAPCASGGSQLFSALPIS